MSSNHKRSSLGWALGISLGIACSTGVVHAGSIGDTYTTGDTLTAGKMDNIKAAVNDNDARIGGVIANTQAGALKTAVDGNTTNITTLTGRVTTNEGDITTLQTDVTNLQNGTPTCGAGTTAVGPICVDNTRAAASTTWIAAVNACRTAGKRLMTPSEYMAAKSLGTIPDMATNGEYEWVNSVASNASADATIAGGFAGRLTASYMGPATAAAIGGTSPTPVDGDIFFGNNAAYDAGFAFIYYRCAR
jgi:hypothetical protein